jgi:hypothetical protein
MVSASRLMTDEKQLDSITTLYSGPLAQSITATHTHTYISSESSL